MRTIHVVGLCAIAALSMACAPELCLDCYGPETGGVEQQCDPDATPELVTAQTIEGSLAAQDGSNRGSCGGNGAEAFYEWTPPAPGSYRIAVESAMDTVLYVRESGPCGDELACNDDANDEHDPELTIELTTEPIVIVVDGFSPIAAGTFTLTIEAQ